MHAGPLITTPSALLLFSPFVSPVRSSSYFVSFFTFYSLSFVCVVFLSFFPSPHPLFLFLPLPLCRYIFLSFLLFISRSVVNILSCAQTPA